MKVNHLQHLHARACFGIDFQTLKLLNQKSKKENVKFLFKNSKNVSVLKVTTLQQKKWLNVNDKNILNNSFKTLDFI